MTMDNKRDIQEIVVISGKGGTGKTSITACLAVLADNAVIADCDVDAADLHLVLSPEIVQRSDFYSGHEAVIRQDDCIGCGICLENCRFGAVMQFPSDCDWWKSRDRHPDCKDCDHCERSCSLRAKVSIREMREAMGEEHPMAYSIDPVACEGCGVCVRFCPVNAIDFPERLCGEWMISRTRCGPMVHARLGVAAENSGKLVSTVRKEARRLAEKDGHRTIIVDGPPGIGCPVIASVTGASLVLIVTEPTVSGEHDLERVLSLAKHFNTPAAVCVNKWDLNPAMTERIEEKARNSGARIVGRIRYDGNVTQAQMKQLAVVETDAPSAQDIREISKNLGLQE